MPDTCLTKPIAFSFCKRPAQKSIFWNYQQQITEGIGGNNCDDATTNAILDRILFRCVIIKLANESFCFKRQKTIVEKS